MGKKKEKKKRSLSKKEKDIVHDAFIDLIPPEERSGEKEKDFKEIKGVMKDLFPGCRFSFYWRPIMVFWVPSTMKDNIDTSDVNQLDGIFSELKRLFPSWKMLVDRSSYVDCIFFTDPKNLLLLKVIAKSLKKQKPVPHDGIGITIVDDANLPKTFNPEEDEEARSRTVDRAKTEVFRKASEIEEAAENLIAHMKDKWGQLSPEFNIQIDHRYNISLKTEDAPDKSTICSYCVDNKLLFSFTLKPSFGGWQSSIEPLAKQAFEESKRMKKEYPDGGAKEAVSNFLLREGFVRLSSGLDMTALASAIKMEKEIGYQEKLLKQTGDFIFDDGIEKPRLDVEKRLHALKMERKENQEHSPDQQLSDNWISEDGNIFFQKTLWDDYLHCIEWLSVNEENEERNEENEERLARIWVETRIWKRRFEVQPYQGDENGQEATPPSDDPDRPAFKGKSYLKIIEHYCPDALELYPDAPDEDLVHDWIFKLLNPENLKMEDLPRKGPSVKTLMNKLKAGEKSVTALLSLVEKVSKEAPEKHPLPYQKGKGRKPV